MKPKDHGRTYWCVSCGGRYHFETEQEVKRHCKQVDGKMFALEGIDYQYFSDREEDDGKDACSNEIRKDVTTV